MSKQDKIARLIRISRSHAAILSSAHGILFPRDAEEYQRATDAIFEVCTDEEILAIESPDFGPLFDADDVAMIREELAQ